MKNRLKILFANSIQMFAGGEIWMLRTLTELQKRGHEVTLLCRPGTELSRRAKKNGIGTFEIKIRGDFDPVTVLQISRFLRKRRIDIILTNMEKELRLCGLAARLAHRPPVVARRGIDYPLKNKIHYRFTYNTLASQLVANSKSTKQALLLNAPWLAADRIQVIYNGIQPENYAENCTHDLKAELKIPNCKLVIGFVGQLDKRKGIDTLLPAFKKLLKKIPDIFLLLVGTGKMETHIKTFIQQNHLEPNVKLVGFQEEIQNVMRTIDLLVLPSWWEGFGIVLIEAMAAGKPTVTTNVSSMPEIVTHEKTGLIVPPRDVEALAAAMENIVLNSRLAQQMGEAGRAEVLRRFTLNKMVDEYETLFYRLI